MRTLSDLLRRTSKLITGTQEANGAEAKEAIPPRAPSKRPELKEGDAASALFRHDRGVRSVALLPDGIRALSGSEDSTLRLWDVKTGTELRRFQADEGHVDAIAVLPDARRALSGSYELYLWDLETGTQLRRFAGTGIVVSIAVLPDAKRALCGRYNGQIQLLDLDSGDELRRFNAHNQLRCVTVLPGGNRALSGSGRGTVQLWDVEAGVELRLFEGLSSAMVYSIVGLQDRRRALCCSSSLFLLDLETGAILRTFEHPGLAYQTVLLGDGLRALSGHSDGTVRLWDLQSGAELRRFEGHTDDVWTLTLLGDGRRFLSGSGDGSIRLWSTDAAADDIDTVGYTTARIALLGDSGVGKTGLGWRIAHGAFREHSSTHGQQFWVINQLAQTREDGTQCEAVLWDLAGQPDYRLIHALFLDQANLGLLLFDPTERERPLAGVEYWLRHLRAATSRAIASGESSEIAGAPTLLVAARADRGEPTLTRAEIESFCKRQGISGYIVTSAKNDSDTGVAELMKQIKAALPWDHLTATTTTRTFKRVKDHVLKLKEAGLSTLLLPPAELRRQLEASDREWNFTDGEMMTAVGHLENHGYIARLQRANGDEAILLTPDLLVNLASSIVLEARRHPRGLGLLDEGRLLAGDYRFPELDELDGADRSTLLDAAASLFLRRNLCFRETLSDRTCLVFPSLINEKRPTDDFGLLDDASYHVSGAVETVYAALVVQLGYTNLFQRDHHWQNQAQYELEQDEICGFRQIDERKGEVELVLSYSAGAGDETRKLFEGAFERFLKRRAVRIGRLPMVACANGHPQLRDAIRQSVDNSQPFFFCSKCGERVPTPQIDEIGVSADKAVHEAEETADNRTKYEVGVAWIKAFRRDRGDGEKKPSCFISYAWGDRPHERWAERLADYLQNADVAVTLDRWHSRYGGRINRFVERIETSEFICALGTPPYRQKYETQDTDPVVRAELDLIEQRAMKRDAIHDTVLPLLCAGTLEQSFPPLLQGFVFVDFREEADFFTRLFELVLTIHRISFEDKMARQHRDELSGASEIELRFGRAKERAGQPPRRVSSI